MTKKGETLKMIAMTGYLSEVVSLLFFCYTALIFIRVVTSWFPAWQAHHLVRFVAFCTDPYLNFFRRIIPPLGGVLDLSPILAFIGLRVLEMGILWLLQ
jgi:YggT family protein